MRILITGSAGDIGRETCKYFHTFKDFQLRTIDVLTHGSANIPFQNLNLLNTDNCRMAVEGMDAVFHLARRPVDLNHDLNEKLNFIMTKNLLEAAKMANVKLFIMASSFHVYGPLAHKKAKETDSCNPISNYGKSKKTCEEIALAYSFETNIDVRILRYFNVYGPNMKNGIIPFFKKANDDGFSPKLNYCGSAKRDFIHVSDVAEANRLALITPGLNRKIINVGTGKPTSVNELTLMLESYMGNVKNIEFSKIPDPLGSLFADTDLAKKLLNFQPKKKLSNEIQNLFT